VSDLVIGTGPGSGGELGKRVFNWLRLGEDIWGIIKEEKMTSEKGGSNDSVGANTAISLISEDSQEGQKHKVNNVKRVM